jgi:uncharacterized membrane-anchored protein YhcB (DUF1043 family)
MKTSPHLCQNLARSPLESETFQTKVVEKFKTHTSIFSNLISENRAVYEIMSKNMVEPDVSQMTQYGAYALHSG